jgi:nicotinamidase-related amidase
MTEMYVLGRSPHNRWRVNETAVDFVRTVAPPRPVEIPATPQNIRLDLSRTALLVVDMQNDFCHSDGWLGSIGVDVSPGRALIEPIGAMLEQSRAAGVPVIWVNWGNRPDLLNLGPSTLHVYNATGAGTGLGDPLANGAPVLELGSWAANILDEFGDTSGDIQVAKFSMSGFWETHLDAILRNLGVTTLLFAGVNLDQCVLCTLQDASFRGYDCILLEDCCATTSPAFCAHSALYNIRQCFGFVASSADLITGMKDA